MTETIASTTSLPDYPLPRSCPYQPPPGYDEYRTGGPVSKAKLFDGRETWVVTGHEQARQILVDAATFSSDRQHPAYPATAPRFEAARKVRNFIGMDPPEHTAQRRPLISSFTAKRVNGLRPGIQEVVDRLVDDVVQHGPGVDLVPTFALPVPSIVISQLLGVPYADHAFFEHESRRIAAGSSTVEESADAFGKLKTYLHELLSAKQAAPGDDLLDVLIADQVSTGTLTTHELVDLALLLLVAGHETTASAIALGVVTLLDHPADLSAERIGGVVEEVLRYTSVVDGITRFATRDTEIDGVPIRAGDAVVITMSAINRDPVAFPDPDAFDPLRSARHHVSFGYGVHQCIGANLARAELEIAFTTLFARLPGLRLAVPSAELEIKEAGGVQGVRQLPVTW
jgi:pentalenic acid synthase